MSLLKKALHAQQFVCVLEWVAPQSDKATDADLRLLMQRQYLAGMPMVAAFADRVGHRSDVTSLRNFERYGGSFPALLHLSGKDRSAEQLHQQLQHMQELGLQDVLLLSGDRWPGDVAGKARVRYLESVSALQQARLCMPAAVLGAALNPFKYLEEEGLAQYYKAEKKLLAGADFFTLQLGFDAKKCDEALQWMQQQASPKPMLACVMALTYKRAQFLCHVPGVTITASMLAALAAEEKSGQAWAQQRAMDRLALQIRGLQLKGYAGIHLSGVHTQKQLAHLEQALQRQQAVIQTLAQWEMAWAGIWGTAETPPVTFAPDGGHWTLGQCTVQAHPHEWVQYQRMHRWHQRLFGNASWMGKVFGAAMRWRLWQLRPAAQLLHQLERCIKKPMVGCDTCGNCRLDQTLYICPETCPKGLSNGPCGGTQLNRCEFGDRECIHSVKYRVARTTEQTHILRHVMIAPVPVQTRHQSSWPRWFNKRDAS